MQRARIALAAVALGVALLTALTAPLPAGARPNVVVVMTDDQTLAQMQALPKTRHLVGDQGVTFTNAIATTPLCCPSRATFLTGRYAHGHGVLRNRPPDGGYPALDQSETLPVWLRRGGYTTAHVGKFLNGYGERSRREVPLGWDRWAAPIGGSAYRTRHYTLNLDGRLVTPERYQTDAYADLATRFVRGQRGPFFLSVAPLAPHGEVLDGMRVPPRPAPRHRELFRDAQLPRPPSFDPPLLPMGYLQAWWRQSLASLAAVMTWCSASCAVSGVRASCATPSWSSPPTTASCSASTAISASGCCTRRRSEFRC